MFWKFQRPMRDGAHLARKQCANIEEQLLLLPVRAFFLACGLALLWASWETWHLQKWPSWLPPQLDVIGFSLQFVFGQHGLRAAALICGAIGALFSLLAFVRYRSTSA